MIYFSPELCGNNLPKQEPELLLLRCCILAITAKHDSSRAFHPAAALITQTVSTPGIVLCDGYLTNWFLTEGFAAFCHLPGFSGFSNAAPSPLKTVPTLEQGPLPIATSLKPDFLGQNTGNTFCLTTLPLSKEKRDLWITELIILKECDLFIVSDILSQIWKSVNVLFLLKANETSSSSHPQWPEDWDVILLPLQIQLNCHYAQKTFQFSKYNAIALKYLDSKCPHSL